MTNKLRYFYDTEFLEDGRTIELISIGIVCEDGREYYAINKDADWGRISENEWLVQNVLSSLPTPWSDSPEYKPKKQIADEVYEFLAWGKPVIANNGNSLYRYPVFPELWAWFAAYDHVALCQLWGKMIDLPPRMPMFTNDLKQEKDRLKMYLPEQPEGLHNALEDARFNVERARLLGVL